MKIADLLLESSTDVVARHYKEASDQLDAYYNRECAQYKHKNAAYYQKYFDQWYNKGSAPVFTDPVTPAQAPYTNKPDGEQPQSPGYRGLQYARARAGQEYDKNVQAPPRNANRTLSQQTQDGMPAIHHGGY